MPLVELAILYRDEETGEISLKWKDAQFALSLETFCKSPLREKDAMEAADFFSQLRADGIL